MSQLLTSNNQQSSYAATWNNAATVFTAWKLNVTDTASNADSLLLDLQTGGASYFSVTKRGEVRIGQPTNLFDENPVQLHSNYQYTGLSWANGGYCLAVVAGAVYQTIFDNNYPGLTISNNLPLQWGITAPAAGQVNASVADLKLYRDGAAGILAQRNGTNTQAFRLYRTYTDSSNYEALELAHATYSSAQYSILRTITAGTGADNINLVLSPSGSGAIVASLPDGTGTGGNARGSRAVDLQMVRDSNIQVASGSESFAVGYGNRASASFSFVGGYSNVASGIGSVAVGHTNTSSSNAATTFGQANTASGLYSVAGGYGNTASDNSAVALGAYNRSSASNSFSSGRYALANKWGQNAHAASNFAAEGDAQRSVLVMRCLTTDDSKTQLYLDGASLQATIPNNTAWHADIRIVGRENAGANHAVFHRKVGIYKNTTAASATLLGTVQTIGTDYKSDAAWAVTITADTGTGALKVEAQGNLDQDVRWVAEVSLVEVAFA